MLYNLLTQGSPGKKNINKNKKNTEHNTLSVFNFESLVFESFFPVQIIYFPQIKKNNIAEKIKRQRAMCPYDLSFS